MKNLLIVESPAKIKTISKFLGKDFKILSTLGHIKDLPKKKIGIHVNKNNIEIDYVVLEKKDKIIKEICREASKAKKIFLGPDPDREGEIIAWHIAEEVKNCANKPAISRIVFNEITKPAIKDALLNPSKLDLNKVAAQQARRILDRWVGYEVSPVLWKKVKKGLSAGRVQSVALKFICMREKAIKEFKPKEYWSINGLFAGKDFEIDAALAQINNKKVDIGSKKEADKALKDIKKQAFTISSIKDTKRLQKASPPFMTSTLQQTAYNQLGFSVDQTMMMAQKLYEGIPLKKNGTPVALITYMRTDSSRISQTAIESVRGHILENFGEKYLPSKPLVYTKKKAQDAHEAIRPIDLANTPEVVSKFLEKRIAKLYELIFRRFVACQMKPAQYAQRQVNISGGDYNFRVTGSTLIFDGHLKALGKQVIEKANTKEKAKTLPKNLKEKMELDLKKLSSTQHFTEPPPRYTQASLVKELEKEGIGRPSTYATILKTIQARTYVLLNEKKKFEPTDLGNLVNEILVKNMPKIMDVEFTAKMEEKLDHIAEGKLKRDKILKDFYEDFKKDVAAFKEKEIKKGEDTGLKCPKCKSGELIIRFGRSGQFVGCDQFPECRFTSNFEKSDEGKITLIETKREVKLLEEKCPKCGKQLREIIGRFGPFAACSGYPKCKYIKQEFAGFPCPECGGKIVKKAAKKTFWGCKNYPKCRFTIPSDIVEKKCPKCKKPYLLKRTSKEGHEILTCHSKECGYKK